MSWLSTFPRSFLSYHPFSFLADSPKRPGGFFPGRSLFLSFIFYLLLAAVFSLCLYSLRQF
jgi:hypothetical protein